MTKIDPSRIQSLISQNFDNTQALGQLGGRSVQVGPAQEPRAQAPILEFVNKTKNLLDRAVTFIRSNSEQRAEQGITRGVKNFDKALGKLFDAMKPDNKGDVDFAKLCRSLETLPGSAKSATSRGVDYRELVEARFKQLNPQTLQDAHKASSSALEQLRWEQVRVKTGSERESVRAAFEQVEMLCALSERALPADSLRRSENRAAEAIQNMLESRAAEDEGPFNVEFDMPEGPFNEVIDMPEHLAQPENRATEASQRQSARPAEEEDEGPFNVEFDMPKHFLQPENQAAPTPGNPPAPSVAEDEGPFNVVIDMPQSLAQPANRAAQAPQNLPASPADTTV